MALTRAQRRVANEIEEVLRIGGYDWRVVEELYEPDARLAQLQRIKEGFIRAKIIEDYVFADELLSVVILSYYFPPQRFSKRYRNKKMTTFIHFVMEEMFLLRKLALVKDIRDFDKGVAAKLATLNALRNAMAHSFVPKQKRDFRKTKKVTYRGQDIYATACFEAYDADMCDMHDYLFQLAFGKRLASFLPELRGEPAVDATSSDATRDDH